MKLKDVKVGGIYYLPIKVKSIVSEDFNDICITDENGDQWNEYDAAEMVTGADIVKAKNEKMDDQVDFWKRDSESAHEETRKLQELLNSKEEGVRKIEEYADQLKKIADDLGDENEKLTAEVATRTDNVKNLVEENDRLKIELEQEKKRVQILEDSNGQYVEQIRKYDIGFKNAEENLKTKQMTIIQTTKRCADLQTQLEKLSHVKDEAERYKALSESLQQRVNELEADKARPVCVAVKEVETPKVEALRKALRGQGNDIRRKRAIINALAERVVYLEGEMKKNG